jgi:DNA-binding CsgD family transcriptional regulator
MPNDSPHTPLPERPYLSPLERRYLWLLTQGHTVGEAQKILGVGRTPTLGMRVRDKLGAATTAHATYKAAVLQLVGPDPECGTMTGYRRHKGRQEDVCEACRREFTEFVDRTGGLSAHRRPQLTDPELYLLRAFDAGANYKALAHRWRISTRTLDKIRASLYRKLDVLHHPMKVRRQAALEVGQRMGYLRPDPLGPPPPPPPAEPSPLTELEVRTLATVADGTSLSQAGRKLGIPASSVGSRLARIYIKLDVAHHGRGLCREAAVTEARRRGYEV